jgi:hypothetical protein
MLVNRQGDASLPKQKTARDGGQDTDAIAAIAICGNGATVSQAPQCRERQPQNVVTGFAAQGRNKAYAARLVIKAGIEKGSASGANQARSHIRI